MRVIHAVVAAAALSVPGVLLANETDAKVGRCVIYAIASSKPAAAEAALGMADNEQRAMRFAGMYADQVKRFKDRGQWNATIQQGWAVEGARACRQVGVRVADY